MRPDPELLRCYAEEKSEAALAELVARHIDLVYSAALRQLGGDSHRAQDVTQIVFTTLARKAATLTSHPVLAGWLYTATQHAAAKAIRAEARRHAREQEAHVMQEIHASDALTIDWERVWPVLDDAMRELDDRDREAVLLRFFARRPFREIGGALNLSEDAARMRVERALDKLHALLARRGVTSTSAALAAALTSHAVASAPAGLATTIASGILAGATGSGALAGGAAGTVVFMSTTKLISGAAAVAALAGVGVGVFGLSQAREANATLATAMRERDAANSRLAETEKRARENEGRLRELAARTAPPAQSPDAARTGAAGGAHAGRAPAAELDVAKAKLLEAKERAAALTDKMTLMADPEMQRARLEMDRLRLGLRFGPLYRNLNLTADQIARFEGRMTESMQETMDIFAAAQSQGVKPNDPAITRLAADVRARFEGDLRALLGEGGVREYQRYEQTYGAREVVHGMLANLAYADAPLSNAQMNRLTEVIAASAPAALPGDKPAMRAGDVNWAAVVEQGRQFLSPPQAEVVRAFGAQARAAQQAQAAVENFVRDRGATATKIPKS